MWLVAVAWSFQVRADVWASGAAADRLVLVQNQTDQDLDLVRGGLEEVQKGQAVVAAGDRTGPDRSGVGEHCARSWGWTASLRSRFRSNEKNAVAPPWDTADGELHYGEYEVPKTDGDFDNLRRYFYRFMPKSTRLRKISMIANPKLWHRYEGNLRAVQIAERTTYTNMCDVEKWLWHGTDAQTTASVLRDGFQTAVDSVTSEVQGAGLFFTPDPRLAHFFGEEKRGQTGQVSRIMLVRVAAGKTGENNAVAFGRSAKAWMQNLRSIRQPPNGFESATSEDHTEVVTFQENTAYPAYVFEYQADALKDANPYTDRTLKAKLGVLGDVMQDPLCQCPTSTNPS